MSGPAVRHTTSMSSTEGESQLRELLDDVVRTRSDYRRELQGRAGSTELGRSREAALRALELYATALTDRRWPIPPRMHQDLQLLRALCGHRRM
jgi:hypothetical protein